MSEMTKGASAGAEPRDLPIVRADGATVRVLERSGNRITWRIDRPRVTAATTGYPEITMSPGDRVLRIEAGGGVQTGGSGLTWKRYVDPSGPNSDRLYHGLIRIPGMPFFKPIKDIAPVVNANPQTIPAEVLPNSPLYLGYEDDDYGDNGYYGHDDGTENQCAGVGPAWIEITVERNS